MDRYVRELLLDFPVVKTLSCCVTHSSGVVLQGRRNKKTYFFVGDLPASHLDAGYRYERLGAQRN